MRVAAALAALLAVGAAAGAAAGEGRDYAAAVGAAASPCAVAAPGAPARPVRIAVEMTPAGRPASLRPADTACSAGDPVCQGAAIAAINALRNHRCPWPELPPEDRERWQRMVVTITPRAR